MKMVHAVYQIMVNNEYDIFPMWSTENVTKEDVNAFYLPEGMHVCYYMLYYVMLCYVMLHVVL